MQEYLLEHQHEDVMYFFFPKKVPINLHNSPLILYILTCVFTFTKATRSIKKIIKLTCMALINQLMQWSHSIIENDSHAFIMNGSLTTLEQVHFNTWETISHVRHQLYVPCSRNVRLCDSPGSQSSPLK